MPRIRLSEAQLSALEIYILDPIFLEDPDDIARLFEPCVDVEKRILDVPEDAVAMFAERLTEAANSADAEEDGRGEGGKAARSLTAIQKHLRGR